MDESPMKEAVRQAVFSILTQPEYGEEFLLEFLKHEGIEDPSVETIMETDNAVMAKLREFSLTL